jgi:hypothetical protein
LVLLREHSITFKPGRRAINKLRVLSLTLLISTSCFAYSNDKDDDQIHYHYSVVPEVGLGFGFSQLGQSQESLNLAPEIGVRLHIENKGMFFTPDVKLLILSGVGGTATTVAPGFIVGAQLESIDAEVYLGMSYLNFFGYNVDSTVLGRAGAAFKWSDSMQLWAEAFFAGFVQETTTTQTDYPFFGFSVGLQWPMKF